MPMTPDNNLWTAPIFVVDRPQSNAPYAYDGCRTSSALQGGLGALRTITISIHYHSAHGCLDQVNLTATAAPGISTTTASPAVHYYGYRYYSPSVGSWLSRDPIGEEGGINIYRYVDNDVMNYVDMDGMAKFGGGEDGEGGKGTVHRTRTVLDKFKFDLCCFLKNSKGDPDTVGNCTRCALSFAFGIIKKTGAYDVGACQVCLANLREAARACTTIKFKKQDCIDDCIGPCTISLNNAPWYCDYKSGCADDVRKRAVNGGCPNPRDCMRTIWVDQ